LEVIQRFSTKSWHEAVEKFKAGARELAKRYKKGRK
jgi:hypothetical protein